MRRPYVGYEELAVTTIEGRRDEAGRSSVTTADDGVFLLPFPNKRSRSGTAGRLFPSGPSWSERSCVAAPHMLADARPFIEWTIQTIQRGKSMANGSTDDRTRAEDASEKPDGNPIDQGTEDQAEAEDASENHASESSTRQDRLEGRVVEIFVGISMFLITIALCLVLIMPLFVGGAPTVSVPEVITLFGVLITGLFVFMTFRIDRGARYEAEAAAQEAIDQAQQRAKTIVEFIAREEAQKAAREEARDVAKKEFARLRNLMSNEE